MGGFYEKEGRANHGSKPVGNTREWPLYQFLSPDSGPVLVPELCVII